MAANFTIGVEEEYQLVDAEHYSLVSAVDRVLPRAEEELGDLVHPELHQAQIEIGTPVCTTLDEVRASLVTLRQGVAAAAEAAGRRIAAAGSHPFARWHEQRITPKPAYENLAETFAHLALEQMLWGCHVHVCILDRDEAIQVMNHARRWLPVLLALSSSSPFWEGVDTGYASYRTEVFGRWPTTSSPHMFDSYDDYQRLVKQLIATGVIDKPARIYWLLRPSAKFDTIEFRVADVCTSVDHAVLIAGLARGIARACHADLMAGKWPPQVRPEVLRAATWRAARSGMTGELVDLSSADPERSPATTVVDRLLDFIRDTTPDAEWKTLRELTDRVMTDGTSAERQRAIYVATDSLTEVARWVVEQTLAL